jgi:hypothetical protein
MDFTCGGCPKKWSGHSMAHCPTCHETFGSVRSFDNHRKEGQCLSPKKIGLTYNEKKRCWIRPLSEEQKILLKSKYWGKP